MGTPPQLNQLHLDFETADLFFIDHGCKAPGCMSHRKGFNPKASSTFRELSIFKYKTKYMGAIQSGRLIKDALTGLGKRGIPIVMPLVDNVNGKLVNLPGDGVAGLGFPDKLNLLPNFPLVTRLIGRPAFTFHVDSMNYTAATGFQDSGFGVYAGNDDAHCNDKFVTHKLVRDKRWILSLKSTKINGKALSAGEVLVRPGHFKIYAPKADVDAIRAAVGAKADGKEWSVACDKLKTLPPLEFTIESTNHQLSAAEYTAPNLDDSSKCMLLFGESTPEVGDTPWIFGDVIFRKNCVMLAQDTKTIGLTTRKGA